jgi:hypothetical protein
MLKSAERKKDLSDAEEAKRAQAAAAIERRLHLGGPIATPKPAIKTDTKPATKPAPAFGFDFQPRWVRLNGGRIGRGFVLGERIFTRREVRWAILAAGVYLLAAVALGLFSTLEHQPSITPAAAPPLIVPGEIQAKELPPLPSPEATASANAG